MRFLICLLLFASVVFAPACSGAFCRVNTQPVNFGSYNTFESAPLDSRGRIIIRCVAEPTTPVFDISIGPSPTSGTFIPRQMSSTTTDVLNYNLYIDKTRTSVLGDGTGGTSKVIRKGKRWGRTRVNVYGRIPPLQDVSRGSYMDTLTVTVTW